MFDFAWSEIALVGVVALVLIGPKDLPIAIKAVTGMVKKARKMAAEFQTHVDEMVKDADLGEVRDHIRDLRSLDIRGTIARAVDSDGSIRKAFTDDPVRTPPPTVTTPIDTTTLETTTLGTGALETSTVDTLPEHSIATPPYVVTEAPLTEAHMTEAPATKWTPAVTEPVTPVAPAFIPPSEALAHVPMPPAFIPPEAVRAHIASRA
jgi:sec-independent protein translocase protein TatB